MRATLRTPECRSARGGTALVVVLIVIVMLSLGAYTYSELMITEYKAADAHGRQVQTRIWAESGVEYVAALLGPYGGGWEADLDNNPDLFHVAMEEGGGFTVVAATGDAAYHSGSGMSSGGIRFGLVDECARLNVNALANFENVEEGIGRQMLMALPNMTESVADSILDWIDADDERREFGAEWLDYALVMPRNGPIDSLEELLLIDGVTPELLYGEDANRNGLLDPNEDDGDLSPPFDNADGVLDLGWAEYLTVHSRESNLRRFPERFGEEKINVNESLLTELFDMLEEELGTDAAQFIVAYRMFGPVEELIEVEGAASENPLTGGAGGGNRSTGDGEFDQAIGRMAESVARGLVGDGGDGDGITRGGLDLSAPSLREISSIYELIDAEVEAIVDEQPTALASPWSSNGGDLQQMLPLLLDTLTVTSAPVIHGRININQARPEVLYGIPGMPPGLPESIVNARSRRGPSGNGNGIFSTTGWLLIEGLVDLPTMRLLDGFLTTRGEVFRVQVVGHSDRGGPVTRVEAVIDASEGVPRIISQRNLSELGPGFRPDQLPRFGVQ